MNQLIKKIGLFPLHSLAAKGGVKNHIMALAKEFRKMKLNPKIFPPRAKALESYKEKYIKIFGTEITIPFNGSSGSLTACVIPGSVSLMLAKEKLDVVHFHNFGFHSLQILSRSTALNIMTMHSYIEDQGVLEDYGFLIDYVFEVFNKKMDGIIAVSNSALSMLDKYHGPKIIIPNGIDTKLFNPRQEKIKKFCDGKTNLLFMGRIQERKGLAYLLKAYKILQSKYGNLRLIVGGEGELRPQCEKYVAENGLRDVCFEGEINEQDVPKYYATCDIFCAPSIFGESFGIVLLEAMASGKPAIGFANLGYSEVMGEKAGECLAKPRDYRALARKIDLVLANPKKRAALSLWGLEKSREYAWPKIARRVMDFYQECARRRNG